MNYKPRQRRDRDNESSDASINISFKNSFLCYALSAIALTTAGCFVAARLPLDGVAPMPETTEISGPLRSSAADADAAKAAITDRAFSLKSGLCSQFARMSVQKAQNSTRYAYLFGASAKITANNFLRYGYAVEWPSDKAKFGGAIRPGDLLFKRLGSGGYGHVGIYAGNNLVAENSSTQYGRIQGAKGYRSLTQYGAFDSVGRLPTPARLYLESPTRAAKLIPSGEFWETTGAFDVKQSEISTFVGRTSSGTKRLSLRDALNAVGYGVRDIEYSKYRTTVTISQ